VEKNVRILVVRGWKIKPLAEPHVAGQGPRRVVAPVRKKKKKKKKISRILQNITDMSQFLFESDKNNGQFIWGSAHVSLLSFRFVKLANIYRSEKCFEQKL
jgi:hypothetical protein